VFSFVTVAASVAVNQAADVLDRRELFVGLDRMGMPREQMDRSRALAVMSPLRLVALGSAAAAAILVAPLTGMALVVQPLSLAVVVVSLAVGIGTVRLAVRSTGPVLSRVLREPTAVP
jgi:VIT1/CCC1 family predicted Fe2+/Mn2+ transporter